MSDAAKNLILVLIYMAGGRATWYNLERALDMRRFLGRIDSVKIAESLISANLVIQTPSQTKPNAFYKVTPIGEEIAKNLLEEKGIEYFRDPLNNSNDFDDLMS